MLISLQVPIRIHVRQKSKEAVGLEGRLDRDESSYKSRLNKSIGCFFRLHLLRRHTKSLKTRRSKLLDPQSHVQRLDFDNLNVDELA